jgi:hypothetical protein
VFALSYPAGGQAFTFGYNNSMINVINSCNGNGLVVAPGFEGCAAAGTTSALTGGVSFAVADIEIYSCKLMQHQKTQQASAHKSAVTVAAQARPDFDDLSEEDEEEEPVQIRKHRDPGAPKGALTAYILFSNAKREQVKRDNPDIKFGDVGM